MLDEKPARPPKEVIAGVSVRSAGPGDADGVGVHPAFVREGVAADEGVEATAIGNLHDYSEDVERDARRRADAQARLRRAQDTYDTAIWYLNAAINNADEIILINDTLGDPLAPMPGQAPEVPAAPANDGQQPPDGASLPHYPFQDPDRDRCLKFRVSRGHIDELCQVLLGEDRCCQYHG